MIKKLLLLGVVASALFAATTSEQLRTITLDVKADAYYSYYDSHNNYKYINSELIDSWQAKGMHDVLKRSAELNITNAGGQKSILLKGQASNMTKLLYRGVELIDPTGPNNAPWFDIIGLSGIDRVEIIKGAASSYYGTSAIAGVVNIVPEQSVKHSFTMMKGANYNEYSFTTGIDTRLWDLGLKYSYLNDYQLSSKADNTEKDRNIIEGLELSTVIDLGDSYVDAFYSDNKGKTDLDSAFNNYAESDQDIYGVKYGKEDWFGYGLDAMYSVSDVKRNYDNGSYVPFGTISNFDVKLNKACSEKSLVFGFNKRYQDAATNSSAKTNMEDTAFYGSITGEWMLNYDFGARVTDYKAGKNITTYTVGLWQSIGNLETKVNYATGYKQPSIYQMLDPSYGNSALTPESSKGIDVAFTYRGFNEVLARANVFNSFVKDRIDYVATGAWTGYYDNVGSDTKVAGYSVGVDFLTIPFTKKIAADYSNTNSRDGSGQILRVPKQKATLDMIFSYFNYDLSIFYTKVASRKDFGNVVLPSYQTVDVAFTKDFGDFSIFVKGVNVLGEDYQELDGFNTLKDVWYVGVSGQL